MCVCCSLGRQRSPPSPTGQHRHMVLEGTGANPLEALFTADCSNLQVCGHILVSSHSLGQFGCSEKLLLQFKERNGRPEGEHKVWTQADTAATSGFKASVLPGNPQCLICWVCSAHGPAQSVEI